MPNAPSQMIPNMLDWRQIWGLGYPRRVVTVRRQSCNSLAVHRDAKCPSAKRIRMIREDTGALSEGATCAWMAADETAGCTEANPQVYVETPLHPEKVTVWCALWAGGIIGPYFFKNDEGYNVTVNGDWYRAMITNFFIPELNNHDVQKLWFQQDGATCHTARATIDLLKDTFGDRLISRFGPVNWPPRSCDLTPLDYFL
ncbi:DUF4817 domain-containing protein [Trichonephila clavipes]|nr:DUF4817 domain-containing protein [Trichonephila clavipes]